MGDKVASAEAAIVDNNQMGLPVRFIQVNHVYLETDARQYGAFVRIALVLLLVAYCSACSYLAKTPSVVVVIVCGLMIILAHVILRWLMRGDQEPVAGRQLCTDDRTCTKPLSARLVCFGTTREIDGLLHIPDFSFEPYIPERAIDWTPKPWQHVPPAVLFLALAIGESVGFAMLGFVITWGIVIGLSRLVMPYYRVSPGRLDVLSVQGVRRSLVLRKRLDLTIANIVIRFDKRKLHIAIPGCEKEDQHIINLHELAHPHEFARYVLQGAVTSSPAALLPEGEFSG